jgi:hypothetical protein
VLDDNIGNMGRIQINELNRELLTFVAEEQTGENHRMHTEQFRVNLHGIWCDCGEFQINRFPCRHVLAGCAYARLDWEMFVDPVYRWSSIFNVYQHEFGAIPNEAYWGAHSGAKLVPDESMRRVPRGRPRSVRIHNTMDLRASGQPRHCKI